MLCGSAEEMLATKEAAEAKVFALIAKERADLQQSFQEEQAAVERKLLQAEEQVRELETQLGAVKADKGDSSADEVCVKLHCCLPHCLHASLW